MSSRQQITNYELRITNPEGFTLIEVIVAFTILSVTLVMVMQLFSAGLKASRASSDYTRAVIYAKDIMEQITDPPTDDSGEFEDGFFWETEVTPYEDSEGMIDNLMQIKVKVTWPDGSYIEHEGVE